MRTISLTRGQVALVDDADYDWLSQWKWYFHATGYAVRNSVKSDGGRPRTIRMHTVLMGTQDGQTIDHRNGNALDNRRENLRWATNSEQARNTFPRGKSHTDLKGVHKLTDRSRERWQARICLDGRSVSLGVYDTAEAAARAYDAAAVQHFGEFARVNYAKTE